MTTAFEIPIRDGRRDASFLAVQLDEAADRRLAVLYLHGFGSSQSGSKAAYFRERFVEHGISFCSFDFQGHGASGGSMLDLTLSRNLEDTARVHERLRSRGYERILVVGSSMGALTGLWYAARQPREITAGLFLAPALDLERTFAERVGEEGMRHWQETGRLHVKNEVVECDLGWGFVEDFTHYPRPALEGSLETPCLLLQGKKDDSVSWRCVLDFAAACPHEAVEVHFFADGDHRLIDHRPRLWALMREFLEARLER